MSKLMVLSLCTALGAGAACSQSADAGAGPTVAPVRLRIAALGDSLTSGHGIGRDRAYPALLERALRDGGLPYAVSNHGVSGDTTAGGVRRLTSTLGEGPQILIVALGANDGLRGVPVSEVRGNLEQIIEVAQERGVAVLLCGMEALPLYGWQYTLDFHRIYPELAAKYSVPLVTFLLDGVVGNRAMLQPDLVHPNAAGAQAIAANIWPYLQPLAVAVAAGT